MPMITWNDSYSVNNPAIDQQHKRLIQLINLLHDAISEGKGDQVMGRILDELVGYTKFHFAAEEKHMDAIGYPDLEAHRRIHEDLTIVVRDFQHDFHAGKPVPAMKILQMLRDWLVNHIEGEDKKFAQVPVAK